MDELILREFNELNGKYIPRLLNTSVKILEKTLADQNVQSRIFIGESQSILIT